MAKVYNYGAGPAKLPEEVLQEARAEFTDYAKTGISIMEMSHRDPQYGKINDAAQQLIRDLWNIPDNYKILFMQGGGTGIFAAVALNLMGKTGTADYFVTGTWSSKAAKEAAKYGKVKMVLPKIDKYTTIPDKSTWDLDPNASYVYYCDNETIHGVEFPYVPETNGVPLVADMSSNIFTREVDVSKFGVIFAGAQKNIGPAGVTVVIIREDLLGSPMDICPTVLDFTVMAKDNSIHNTPPTFCIYMVNKVLEWVKKNGGVNEMRNLAKQKSSQVYSAIDNSNGFYKCPVEPAYRSRMNIPFRLPSEELEKTFLNGAEKLKMIQLKGHRSVGGIRASLYNAAPLDHAKILVAYMNDFRKKYGN